MGGFNGMISKTWVYYFEREFELFRMRLNDDKGITIQNLEKRIDAISKESGAITTSWKNLYIIQDLKALKSLSTFLSIQGIDFENKMFVKVLIKGGELALYQISYSDEDNFQVKPILRCTQTYVGENLQKDEWLHELDSYSLIFIGKPSSDFKDWTVIFDSANDKDLYQFDDPILVMNYNVNDFPYQIRQRSYFDMIRRYTLPNLNFKYGRTVEGTTTVNGIRLAYYIPRMSET